MQANTLFKILSRLLDNEEDDWISTKTLMKSTGVSKTTIYSLCSCELVQTKKGYRGRRVFRIKPQFRAALLEIKKELQKEGVKKWK